MPRSRWTERLQQWGLAALYFTVVTPMGLCTRVVWDPLARSWDDRRTSYLEPVPSHDGFATLTGRPDASPR